MTNRHTFIQSLSDQHGATLIEDNHIRFAEKSEDYSELQQQKTVTPLVQLGVIAFNGSDAKKFLQGQVTCDIQELDPHHCLLGARCNPKGRMLTNFLLFELSEDHLLMVMHASMVTACMDELAKYAAFFKVELSDASDEYVLFGIAGPNKNQAIATEPETTQSITVADIRSPIQSNRQLIIVTAQQAQSLWKQLISTYTATGTEYWQLLDILSGLGWVQAETADMFIPQMLNLQAIEGISFKKGCYTGQEVVARMKYLGKLKRRMYLATSPVSDDTPAPGTPCYIPGKEQSIGNVVTAVNGSSQYLLLVLTDEAAQAKELMIGTKGTDDTEHPSTNKTINFEPLPYSLEEID